MSIGGRKWLAHTFSFILFVFIKNPIFCGFAPTMATILNLNGLGMKKISAMSFAFEISIKLYRVMDF